MISILHSPTKIIYVKKPLSKPDYYLQHLIKMSKSQNTIIAATCKSRAILHQVLSR